MDLVFMLCLRHMDSRAFWHQPPRAELVFPLPPKRTLGALGPSSTVHPQNSSLPRSLARAVPLILAPSGPKHLPGLPRLPSPGYGRLNVRWNVLRLHVD